MTGGTVNERICANIGAMTNLVLVCPIDDRRHKSADLHVNEVRQRMLSSYLCVRTRGGTEIELDKVVGPCVEPPT